MVKIIQVAIILVLTSFYFFPFEPYFLPGYNVKMLMAVMALPVFLLNMAMKHDPSFLRDILYILLLTVPIFVFSWLSNLYNDTYDYTYNNYFISVLVWLAAAYIPLSLMRAAHGYVDVKIAVNYLACVCVLQCGLALLMSYVPAVSEVVDGLMSSEAEAYMGVPDGRMHGLGCSLDVAGGRFAAVLIMIAVVLPREENSVRRVLYLLSFYFIAVVGNMIARTATVGILLSLVYWGCLLLFGNAERNGFGKQLLVITAVCVLVATAMYKSDHNFRNNVRFAFEGFISLAEEGHWETHSTDILFGMVVFPDNAKTWLIGDGYFDNPVEIDPYYIGESYSGFYKATDIGYLRFIFYFGVFGLISMIAFFVVTGRICIRRLPEWKTLIVLLLVLNMTVWFKVSSDMLPSFSILIVLAEFKLAGYSEKLPVGESVQLADQQIIHCP